MKTSRAIPIAVLAARRGAEEDLKFTDAALARLPITDKQRADLHEAFELYAENAVNRGVGALIDHPELRGVFERG